MATIRLFGAFGDMAGWSSRQIEAPTLGALKAAVAAGDPALALRLDHVSTLVILNGTVLAPGARQDDVVIAPSDELAFGPPVSGG